MATTTLNSANRTSNALTTTLPSAEQARAKVTPSTSNHASCNDSGVAGNEPGAIIKKKDTTPSDPRLTRTLNSAKSTPDALTTPPAAEQARAKVTPSTSNHASDDSGVAGNEPGAIIKNKPSDLYLTRRNEQERIDAAAIIKNKDTAPSDPRLTRRNERERIDASARQGSIGRSTAGATATSAHPPQDAAKVTTAATDAPGESNTVVGNKSCKIAKAEPTTTYDSHPEATPQSGKSMMKTDAFPTSRMWQRLQLLQRIFLKRIPLLGTTKPFFKTSSQQVPL